MENSFSLFRANLKAALAVLATSLPSGYAQDLTAPFTRITTGVIATERNESETAAWGDYDNDGFLDLFVGNAFTSAKNSLFHNNGNGTFTKITTGPIATAAPDVPHAAAWADYNNDGFLDLIVGQLTGARNPLYQNLGGGSFVLTTPETVGDVATDAGRSVGVSWVDYDNDGLLDLFVANGAFTAAQADFLFHNEGNGRFRRVENALTEQILNSNQGTWADFDNDGDMDLIVTHYQEQGNTLFRNDGNGHFTNVSEAAHIGDHGKSVGAAWGDYDNDGDLDLIISNYKSDGPAVKNFFYRNEGDGSFTRITDGAIATDSGDFLSCAWIDYDNDGWLDLFLTANPTSLGKNRLYHNNGDGTFTKVTQGSLVTTTANPAGCSWGDYDNDGFLDVFVANGGLTGEQPNGLYHNNTNQNAWIKLRCVGTVSNRSAIGAKVRVKARIGGVDRWQMRQIVGAEGWLSFNALDVLIGLGDAALIDTLRVEWPSGLVQDFRDVAVKQTLTVVEGTSLSGNLAPTLSITRSAAEGLTVSWDNADYLLESSPTLSQPLWRTVPEVSGTSYTVVPGAEHFFRLKHR